jgi:hypothetical protein
MNSPASILLSVESLLRAHGLSVRLGAPTGETDIAIWPWQMVVAPRLAVPPIGGLRPGQPNRQAEAIELRLLLISSGAEDSVEKLTLAHSVLLDSPVIQVGGSTCQVVATDLAPSELAALFTAGGFKLTLSCAYTVRLAPR